MDWNLRGAAGFAANTFAREDEISLARAQRKRAHDGKRARSAAIFFHACF